MNRGFVVLLFLLVAPGILSAQSGLRFTNLSVAQGLSQNTVNAIAEDQHGFLWLATQDGLNRYDGRQLETWPMYGRTDALTDRFVTAVASSDRGAIWAGTRHGLNRIDANRGELSVFFAGSRPYHDAVEELIGLNAGAAVIHSGVLYLVHDTSTSYASAYRWTGARPTALARDGDYVMVADEEGKIHRWNGMNQQLVHDVSPQPILGLRKQVDALWAWTATQLYQWTSEGSQTWSIPDGLKITDLVKHGEEHWIGTSRGIHLLTNHRLVSIEIADQASEGLAVDYIQVLQPDRFGGLWIGTTRFGAFRHDAKVAAVLHFPGKYFADPIVWATLLVDNQLFVGTTAGLDRFTVKEGWNQPGIDPINFIQHEQRWLGFHTSALAWHDNRVWIGTRDAGLLALVRENDTWEKVEMVDFETSKAIYSIDASRANRMVMSASHHALILENGELKRVRLNDLSGGKAPSNYTHHVLVQQDSAWLCSTTGLHCVTLPDLAYHSLHAVGDSSKLPFEVTSATSRGRDGRIWVATLGGGVARLSADAQRVELIYAQEQGMLNSVVYGLVETDEGWIFSTNNGISILSADGRIRNCTSRAGIPFGEHSQNAFGRLAGHPWFGGIDGFYIVTPSYLATPRAVRQLVIDEMRVNYQTMHPADRQHFLSHTSAQRTIQLLPGDNSLSLNVRVPGFVNDQVQVFYRMQGIVNEWVELDRASNQIHFTTLPGGEYVLELKHSDSGNGEAQIEQWIINVKPPFTEQTWFFILIALILTGTTYGVVKYNSLRRLRVEILKREAVERVKKERERISMDLHDNIGAQITHVITRLDNLSYSVSAGKVEAPDEALDHLSDFARGTMQQLRDTIWTLAQEDIVLTAFVDRVHDYMSRVLAAFETQTLRIQRIGDHEVTLPHEATVQLFRVLQEALNNAMKYSQGKHFELVFKVENARLTVEFTDDGVGFNLSDEHDKIAQGHYGLRNMRMRMERMGAHFEVDAKLGKGCKIKIELPLS